MFREDILLLLPAIIIAIIQVFIWGRLPEAKKEETEIPGEYSELGLLRIRYMVVTTHFLLLAQLVFPLAPIFQHLPDSVSLRLFGYAFIFMGVIFSLKGLKDLGDNWTGMDEYRIKKGQALVEDGIYRFVRHPIYTAIIFELVGFELVANSYLFVIFLIGSIVFFSYHIKKEELLLSKKFGKEFTLYKNKTKKFIPYIF